MYESSLFGVALASFVVWSAPAVLGFCGFYVAKADTKLFNKASQVVLVRDGDRTVMTMANDFKGDLKEFAVVIPVPTFLQREQIHVGDKALVDHLDAYSAPRLVEYFDEDPCRCSVREYAHGGACGECGRGGRRREPGAQPRRDHRGPIHRRRVRHPDSLGAAKLRARNVAARERLQDPAGRIGGAVELPEAEHALLRREGQSDGAGQARLLVPAPAAGGVRIAEIHAADPSRHGERGRRAGTVRLRA